MPDNLSKEEIIKHLGEASNRFSAFCSAINEELFFKQPATKWSIAQNVTHLITSAKITSLAYRLPKFIVRIYSGTPNRNSRTYNELVMKYKLKLQQGGQASGRFVAKPASEKIGKEKIMNSYNRAMDVVGTAIQKKWNDNQLDNYLAPHPLLGKITLRELGYFTISHTEHHFTIIKDRLKD